MEISPEQLADIIKKAVGDALATFASGGAAPLMAPHDTSGDDTSGQWKPCAPATSIGELDRNACSFEGRDSEGYRHRSHSPSEIPQFNGSLEDAIGELKAARVWQGDELDFGPDQVGSRFRDWASMKEIGAGRGLVCRYALMTNLIPTTREKIVSFQQPPEAAAFEDMTSADLWAWLLKQRGLTGGASGAEIDGSQLDTLGGGGRK